MIDCYVAADPMGIFSWMLVSREDLFFRSILFRPVFVGFCTGVSLHVPL
jgi:hypothetical protein